MKVNLRTRLQYRIQSGVFVLLFIAFLGLSAWLSHSYSISFDLSSNQRNSLSPESARLLNSIEHPLKITLFVSPVNGSRDLLKRLFERYQRLQPNIDFEILNPDFHPDMLREFDIRYDGEVLFRYQGRKEKVSQVSEANVTNAIQRLVRQQERWLVFLHGHGERNPYGDANHDYSLFAGQLAALGYEVESLNLTEVERLPDNTDVLIIANPRVELLPGEISILNQYIEAGGNLLWLADPDPPNQSLNILLEQLDIEFLPGIVVDPNSQLMGLDRIDFTLIGNYPRHPVTQNLESLSIFPQARALEFLGEDRWQQQVFLNSHERSWNETGALQGDLINGDNPDEMGGPLKIGVSLARSHHNSDDELVDQRIAVVGDADFISNRYLGNGSNVDIGLNLINWLSHDDKLIAINPRPAPDTRLELSQIEQLSIAVFFLLALPIGLVVCGVRIWFVRRKR